MRFQFSKSEIKLCWVLASIFSACGGLTDSTSDSGHAPDAGRSGITTGAGCASASECTSGFCVTGVCCGTACEGECQACADEQTGAGNGTCAPARDGTQCRDAGPCDLAETCTAGRCAPDVVAPASTVCRSASGECDVAETCDGRTALCPTDLKVAANTECQPASGDCDVPDVCDGLSSECSPQFKAAATLCRASAGECDPAETCTGTSAVCPSDSLEPSSYVCRGSAGDCDVDEFCTGSSANCPSDTLRSPGFACRTAAGDCDLVEVCNGSSVACPSDVLKSNATVCRASSGSCDVEESCTGTLPGCPSDAYLDAGIVCRDTEGVCDIAEACPGSSSACPGDVVSGPTTLCRASAGPCDTQETCSGSSAGCPTDEFASSSVVCRTAVGNCDLDEACTGNSTACPGDSRLDAGVVCRASAGACDVAEACTGGTDCPTDGFQPTTSLACAPYSCTGTGVACTTACTTNDDCAPDYRSVCRTSTCLLGKAVFVTSSNYANGAFGSLAIADAKCEAHATDAGLGTGYHAWLSDSTTPASLRIGQAGVPYVKRDNGQKVMIAVNYSDLRDSSLLARFDNTEFGVTKANGTAVWTGTNTNASAYTLNCTNWTSSDAGVTGLAGTTATSGQAWTSNGLQPCNQPAALYCIQQ